MGRRQGRRPVTVRVATTLDAPPEAVWTAMQRLSTFRYLVRGVLGVPAMRERDEVAEVGKSGSSWILLFHIVPLHRHTIEVTAVDPGTHTIRTHEHGGMVRSWDHTLHAEALPDGRTRYSDTVEIDAGAATPLVVAFAHLVYRYRHLRWRRLVRTRLAPKTATGAPPT